jgi:sugar lactone lactonase YvrE
MVNRDKQRNRLGGRARSVAAPAAHASSPRWPARTTHLRSALVPLAVILGARFASGCHHAPMETDDVSSTAASSGSGGADPCGGETFNGRCEGTKVIYCDAGVVSSYDCGPVLACGQKGGMADCVQPNGLPEPILIAEGFLGARRIAIDAYDIYWTTVGGFNGPDPVNAMLMKAPLGGGPTTTLFESPDVGVIGIALEADDVYFTTADHAFMKVDGSGVRRVPKAGGATTLLIGNHYGPRSLALTPTDVVFTTDGGGGAVRTVPKAGGAATSLATNTSLTSAVVVDSTTAYFASDGSGVVSAVPLAGGAVTTLASGQNEPAALALDDKYVYWVNAGTPNSSDGSVMRVAKAGGNPEVLSTGLYGPAAIAVDATGVYVASAREVDRIPLSGGAPTPLAVAQDGPIAVALDQTSIYYLTAGGQYVSALWKTSK